jgi:hypothetical protein
LTIAASLLVSLPPVSSKPFSISTVLVISLAQTQPLLYLIVCRIKSKCFSLASKVFTNWCLPIPLASSLAHTSLLSFP